MIEIFAFNLKQKIMALPFKEKLEEARNKREYKR